MRHLTAPPMSKMITSSSTSSSSKTPQLLLWIIQILILLLVSPFTNPLPETIMLPTHPDLTSSSSNSTQYHNKHISSSCPAPQSTTNFRPIIGILTHPGDGASGRLKNGTGVSYIAASYVKFVESAGALVVPLLYTEPPHVLLKKLDLLNGVLFTGGWAKRGLYFDVVSDIFKKVLEKNDAGHFFPCYAICLGFELLTMIISKDNNILEKYNASYMASSLQFVEDVSIKGTVFQRFPPDLLRKLNTDCLVMQNHKFSTQFSSWVSRKQPLCVASTRGLEYGHNLRLKPIRHNMMFFFILLPCLTLEHESFGISPKTLEENQHLSSFFRILTISADRNDKVYVSTAQAQHYPVTAFQWHPEKNAYEGGSTMIPHSEDAIQVTQWVANYFISEARKSSNRAPVQEVLDNLIYNYNPTYCGKAGKGFDEVYIFA